MELLAPVIDEQLAPDWQPPAASPSGSLEIVPPSEHSVPPTSNTRGRLGDEVSPLGSTESLPPKGQESFAPNLKRRTDGDEREAKVARSDGEGNVVMGTNTGKMKDTDDLRTTEPTSMGVHGIEQVDLGADKVKDRYAYRDAQGSDRGKKGEGGQRGMEQGDDVLFEQYGEWPEGDIAHGGYLEVVEKNK